MFRRLVVRRSSCFVVSSQVKARVFHAVLKIRISRQLEAARASRFHFGRRLFTFSDVTPCFRLPPPPTMTSDAPRSKAADVNAEANSSGRDSAGQGQSKQPAQTASPTVPASAKKPSSKKSKQPAQAASPTVSASAKKPPSKKNRRCDVKEASKSDRRSDGLETGRQTR